MKVLIVSTYIPPNIGGAEQVAWETAVRLAKHKDLEVHILTTGKEGTETKNNIIIHKVPDMPLKEFYYSTLSYKKIKKIMDKNKFDLVHFHIPLPWAFVLRKYKMKKIVTLHGIEACDARKKYPHRIIRTILTKRVFKKMNKFTTVSKWYSKEVKKYYHVNCEVIPNGIDVDFYRPLKVKKENNVILFVGRIIKIKGVLELLNVANDLKKYEFWFAGKGPLSKKINLKNTKYLGFKNGSQLIEIYNKATICVLPSHTENMPVVALEAMSCGSPVIATKKGFSEFIVNNENGILIDSKNEKQLKDSIIRLMKNPGLRNTLGNNARKTSLKYDWDYITSNYYNLYKDLLAK